MACTAVCGSGLVRKRESPTIKCIAAWRWLSAAVLTIAEHFRLALPSYAIVPHRYALAPAFEGCPYWLPDDLVWFTPLPPKGSAGGQGPKEQQDDAVTRLDSFRRLRLAGRRR